MNKIYKLKYDRRRGQPVVVSELAGGAGKEATGQAAAPAGVSTPGKLTGTLAPLMSLLPETALANFSGGISSLKRSACLYPIICINQDHAAA